MHALSWLASTLVGQFIIEVVVFAFATVVKCFPYVATVVLIVYAIEAPKRRKLWVMIAGIATIVIYFHFLPNP